MTTLDHRDCALNLSSPALQRAHSDSVSPAELSFRAGIVWAAGASVAFHASYAWPGLSWLILVYLYCLLKLSLVRVGRHAFYLGLLSGISTAAPQMNCLWVIFGARAFALYLILAFWIGLFVAMTRLSFKRFGRLRGALLIPFLWTGLEYFRSELYYLKFSWLNVGYSFSGWQLFPFHIVGMYGIGFLAAVC